MLPKIHSNVVEEHKFQQTKASSISDRATDQLSARDFQIKKPQLPVIENRFASTGRHISGFGLLRGQIFPNQKQQAEAEADSLNVKGQKSPQHKFEKKFKFKPIMTSFDSQSPRGAQNLTFRETSDVKKDA